MRPTKLTKGILAFVVGVGLVSQVFKLTDSEASGGHEVVHGVISMQNDGKTYIKQLDGAFDQDIILNAKEDYEPFAVVTVVLDGGEVVNDYLTYGKELDKVEKAQKGTIAEYRQGIAQTLYEN